MGTRVTASLRAGLGLFGLGLFLTGFLVAPSLHRLDLTHAGHHCDAATGDDRHGPGDHAAERCSICRLAGMALTGVPGPAMAPQSVAATPTLSAAPSHPDFRMPRLLPFACGPPVCN